ncbi:ribonuclease H-like YkuK family protein [Patescibacteria group bacterium]|nr:ribonuclease H-like YkuK family protein [Patescibacteria group bacterium]MBU1931449.1 ribonuclease H-like YkuK family protein [Patescibacteria group bacterium]
MKVYYLNNPTKGKLSLTKTVNEVAEILEADPEALYRLVIGSDSQDRRLKGKKMADLVCAIVIHKKGCGGRYFWHKEQQNGFPSLRNKIYAETLASLALAEKFMPLLTKRLNGKNNYELEIHIDVGQHGETRDMIKEVVGMVTGNGFTAKTKPDSYGATCVADRYA